MDTLTVNQCPSPYGLKSYISALVSLTKSRLLGFGETKFSFNRRVAGKGGRGVC